MGTYDYYSTTANLPKHLHWGTQTADAFFMSTSPVKTLAASPSLGGPLLAPRAPRHKPGTPLSVEVEGDTLYIGNVAIRFMRTLRIPDDGKEYPLPPSLGLFPLRRARDYEDKVPASWLRGEDLILPMYQREAMWLSFLAESWRPNALKVGIGGINALSGKEWSEQLHATKSGSQDYMVVPDQPWLDGINAGKDAVKQFVAMALGGGYTVEGQITGEEKVGGLQLCVFEPVEGKFPDSPPASADPNFSRGGGSFSQGGFSGSPGLYNLYGGDGGTHMLAASSGGVQCMAGHTAEDQFAEVFGKGRGIVRKSVQEMGLGAGGSMRQKIYADAHGLETWDQDESLCLTIHLLNSETWTEITGEEMPETAVTAKEYSKHGYPWFDLYDEDRKGVRAPKVLKDVKSIREMDAAKGKKNAQDDSSVSIPDGQIEKLALGDARASKGTGKPKAKPRAKAKRPATATKKK